MSDDNKIRINSFLSKCGLGSRRECEKFVTKKRVTVNGEEISELSTKVDCYNDEITCDGKKVELQNEDVYVMLNKPRGCIVSRKGFGKDTVYTYLKGFPKNLAYAGRLDEDSSGLLFLTTDGMMIEHLSHPRYKISKIYVASLNKALTKDDLFEFRRGIEIEEGLTTLPCQIDILDESQFRYRIILKEGKNRQIRKMVEKLDKRVIRLSRVAFGPLSLGNLKFGNFRNLTKNEIFKLKRDLKLY